MKNLKDILKESILDDIDTNIEQGDKEIYFASPENYIDFIESNVLQKYKKNKRLLSKIYKTSLQPFYEIRNFDENKKYFVFSKLAFYSVKRKDLSTFYVLHVTDGEKLNPNFITGVDGNVKINTHPYIPDINDIISYNGKNRVLVYEVPKELEWLYEYVKTKKLY